MAILEVRNLSFTYNGADKKALENINFEVKKGEFVVICGESGCGKSTLLRLMKKQLAPKGEKTGGIFFDGTETGASDERVSAAAVGFVMQNPDNQIVTDKVWRELAFGLEALGEKPDEIRKKIAEICGFFGITEWYHKKTTELSGGQKQLLNLAAVMLMRPEILLLDEPTGRLDPVAASEFISALSKLNRELGLTIVLAEHRLEDIFPIADKVLIMDKAVGLIYGAPRAAAARLNAVYPNHIMRAGLPAAARIYNMLRKNGEAKEAEYSGKYSVPSNGTEKYERVKTSEYYEKRGIQNEKNGGIEPPEYAEKYSIPKGGSRDTERIEYSGKYSVPKGEPAYAEYPLTVREGREFLEKNYIPKIKNIEPPHKNYESARVAAEIADGYFRYERNTPDVLNGLNLKVYENEILCILGGNGAGKTTLLKILSGLKRVYAGKVRIWDKKIKDYPGASLYRGNIALLPQNPQAAFVKSGLMDELRETASLMEYGKAEGEKRIDSVCADLDIAGLLNSHPYDLSGGEQQKAALAKILLLNPRILLLDEPTKGLDAHSKNVLAHILKRLQKEGKTIVIVTHDVEFAAENADRAAMFFDGKIAAIGNPVDFFRGNTFYTTAAYRISRGFYDNAVTAEAVAELCRKNAEITD
ncbi:MAG: ATP-binding cassette domain-containing protein [Clostridiales bacterium]|jgi:energy-coupling factor transport system ATP-binding protein|nr:ATP-binding cassette domain-containing protein [Clostridiales bacterium]